jgi:hypothetical protein
MPATEVITVYVVAIAGQPIKGVDTLAEAKAAAASIPDGHVITAEVIDGKIIDTASGKVIGSAS